MLPFSPGLDFSRLAALRGMMFGGGPMHGVPPMYGSAPPMNVGGFGRPPMQDPTSGIGANGQPWLAGNGTPEMNYGPQPGAPTQPVTFGSNPPMNLANLLALRSFAPQAQNGMRFPMMQQY